MAILSLTLFRRKVNYVDDFEITYTHILFSFKIILFCFVRLVCCFKATSSLTLKLSKSKLYSNYTIHIDVIFLPLNNIYYFVPLELAKNFRSPICSGTSKASPNQPPQTGPTSPRQPRGPATGPQQRPLAAQGPAAAGVRKQGPTGAAIDRKKSPKQEEHRVASASVKKKSPKQEPPKPKWRSSLFSRSNTIASLLMPSSGGDKNKNAKKHERRSYDVTKKTERQKVTSATSWTYDNGDDVTVL